MLNLKLIGGQTLHASLQLPIGKSKIFKLTGDPLHRLQNEFRDVNIIAIDEKSMISLTTLYHIDFRLKEAKPKKALKPFGGVSIILMGGTWPMPSLHLGILKVLKKLICAT